MHRLHDGVTQRVLCAYLGISLSRTGLVCHRELVPHIPHSYLISQDMIYLLGPNK